MKAEPQTVSESQTDPFAAEIVNRLERNKPVRRSLPQWGRIHVDRQLPFLCVYRRPARRPDHGTDQLISGQPAYVLASAQRDVSPLLSQLVTGVARTSTNAFGRVLLVEVWADQAADQPGETGPALRQPAFRLVTLQNDSLSETLTTLETELSAITIQKRRAFVGETVVGRPAPPRFPPLIPDAVAVELNCARIGIAVRPIYRHSETDVLLPLVMATLVRDFNLALQRTFFTFARTQTPYRPRHYHMLGRQATVKAVWRIDEQLAKVSSQFDFLLQVTPVNAQTALQQFRKSRFQRQPTLRYRPQTADPALLKRQLWAIRIEQVEDPTLQHLFHEKRKELDLQVSMLSNINRPEFLLQSRQLFGQPDASLVATANALLADIPTQSREQSGLSPLNAEAFSSQAQDEIRRYQEQNPGFDAKVSVRKGLAGMMVSKGNLLVGQSVKISPNRAEALLSHEVGVHALTYFNGRAQPLKLLSSGLAGYEELQEGLAVLAEYLVGGLSRPRMRLLAGRVVAADALVSGATFVDTYRLLARQYGFTQHTAFAITLRTYRAGGLTKDAIYLRGLLTLLHLLTQEPLTDLFFVGKIATDHLPIMQELQRRKVLKPLRWRPHFLAAPESEVKLGQLARGLNPLDLAKGKGNKV